MGEVKWGKRPTGSVPARPAAQSMDDFVWATSVEVELTYDLRERAEVGSAAEGTTLEKLIVAMLEARFPVTPALPDQQKSSSSL